MSAVKRVFCSVVATAPLKQASSSPTVMPVGGILERTSSPVGKGAVWGVGSAGWGGAGAGEGPRLERGCQLGVGFGRLGILIGKGEGEGYWGRFLDVLGKRIG